MCSRHAPEYGADSEQEYLDPRDITCDICLRRIYDGSIRPETQGGSTLWKCGGCRARDAARYAAMTGEAA